MGRLKIVDDDIDVSLNEEIQADLTADNDEAPQIVSVIDDRPPSLRIDEETRTNLWKPIGSSDVSSEFEKKLKFEGNIKLSKTMGIKHDSLKKKTGKSDINKIVSSDRQRSIKEIKEDVSLQSIKIKQENISSDQDFSPVRQHRKSEDFSPPRRGRKQAYSDSDNFSPQRNRVKDSDNSPLKSGKNKDISPPRKIQKKQDSDISPPRKNKSPSRSGKDNDISPPRKNQTQVHKDLSPPRKGRSAKEVSSPRKITKGEDEDNSPPRKRRESSPPRKKSRWGNNDEGGEKMEKTLDGKTAGLQNAADLVKETLEFKKREDELFKKLSSEVSGANATTVVRRKKKDEDSEEEDRKRKAEEENKEKYNKWGKGLKQVEDVNEKIKSDLYEMSKPLARYADDDDLEKYLKDQEREGDPMLAYIRQKKRKKAVVEGATVVQQYEGDAPPNRFGIRPGYRWDGVDRSNGYEKKWFEVQNSRKANIEESYKWSTEDM